MKDARMRFVSSYALLCSIAVVGSATDARAQLTSGPCCLPNGSCTVTFSSTCSSQGGVMVNGRDGCTGVVCTPTGACCLSNGACSQLSASACASSGGEYRGNGTVCASQTCGGACCQTDGTCEPSNAPSCSSPEVFHGLGSVCANVDCVGGCCAGDGSCVLTTEFDCQNNRDGEFLGLEATCAGAICTGACCFLNKSCAQRGQATCITSGGLFQGLGSVCGDDCPTVMPTAFTYQGQLKREGVPLSGLIDARFSLWLSPTGEDPSNRIGGVLPRIVEVVNGLFTVEVDFGQNAFNGNARWLQVELHDEESDAFVTLQPRQPLTPVPYALQTRGVVVLSNGNVGIGTKTPAGPLHIQGGENDGVSATLRLTTSNGAQTLLLDGNEIDALANGLFLNNNSDENVHLVTGGGNVGIGTGFPAAKLDVRGNLRLGANGEFFAPGGAENLRIVRGTVIHNGNIFRGSGFSVTHPEIGDYVVSFDPPFSDFPTITATVDNPFQFPSGVLTDGLTASSVTFRVFAISTSSSRDEAFHFIAIGPR